MNRALVITGHVIMGLAELDVFLFEFHTIRNTLEIQWRF